jgi:branched-chain amino acid transport system substrate-binding protein
MTRPGAPATMLGQPGGQPILGGFPVGTGSGAHVALLAPLSGPNAERGTSLAQAAKLALEAPGSPQLDVLDTQGTPEGAANAARTALANGAGLILGPLTAQETAAASAVATPAGVGMLAFTSEVAQQRPGVWVLGLTPEQQVRRLVGASMAQGKSHFAALLPPNDYGRAMSDALIRAATSAGAGSPEIRTVDGSSMSSANAAVRDLSGYAGRRGPLDAQIKAARAQGTPEGRKLAVELSKRSIPAPSFDALLLAATGDQLSQITSLLPYYDIDRPAVRVLGPALWANPAARGGADLNGAWFAAPDPAARAAFDQQYNAKFGQPAPGLADLAYDAAAIARVVGGSGGFSPASLARAEGGRQRCAGPATRRQRAAGACGV